MAPKVEALFVDPGLLRQAEQLCQLQLRGDPENRATLRSLAELYRKLGRLEEAAALYERLCHLDPEDAEAAYLHAILGGTSLPPAPTDLRAGPLVILKNFLPPEFHEALLPFVLSVEDQFVPAMVGNNILRPEVRETLEYRGPWDGWKRMRSQVLEVMPKVLPRLHIAPFEVQMVEVQLRAYRDGHFYKAHMDAPAKSLTTANRRMLNYVYYFHRQTRPYTGGELLVFDTDPEANRYTSSRFTRVVPEDNTLVFFPPSFYHCVLPVRCPSQAFADSRFVINGHFHKRPEAAPASSL